MRLESLAVCGEVDDEAGAWPLGILDVDRAAVQRGDLARDVESQPKPVEVALPAGPVGGDGSFTRASC